MPESVCGYIRIRYLLCLNGSKLSKIGADYRIDSGIAPRCLFYCGVQGEFCRFVQPLAISRIVIKLILGKQHADRSRKVHSRRCFDYHGFFSG